MTPCLVSNKRPEAYPGPCQRSMELSLRENMECPNTGFFSGPNTGKYEPEKNPYLDTFHAVQVRVKNKRVSKDNTIIKTFVKTISDLN